LHGSGHEMTFLVRPHRRPRLLGRIPRLRNRTVTNGW
jgi:hypothetical protein